MKAKFLKRIELEKGDEVKLVMIVDRMSPEVVALIKGEMYDIALCESKLPNMEQSPKELLSQALTLISQASEGIKEDEVGVVEHSYAKDDKSCGNCVEWAKDDIWPPRSTPLGSCTISRDDTPIYHWCSYWRSNAEEDKDDKTADDSQEQKGICKGVDGEEPSEQGIHGPDGG